MGPRKKLDYRVLRLPIGKVPSFSGEVSLCSSEVFHPWDETHSYYGSILAHLTWL